MRGMPYQVSKELRNGAPSCWCTFQGLEPQGCYTIVRNDNLLDEVPEDGIAHIRIVEILPAFETAR